MPRVKIIKQTATPYTTSTLKRKLVCKNIDIIKTKLLSSKHKNGNDNANEKRKSEHAYTKMHKMPRQNTEKTTT